MNVWVAGIGRSIASSTAGVSRPTTVASISFSSEFELPNMKSLATAKGSLFSQSSGL